MEKKYSPQEHICHCAGVSTKASREFSPALFASLEVAIFVIEEQHKMLSGLLFNFAFDIPGFHWY